MELDMAASRAVNAFLQAHEAEMSFYYDPCLDRATLTLFRRGREVRRDIAGQQLKDPYADPNRLLQYMGEMAAELDRLEV